MILIRQVEEIEVILLPSESAWIKEKAGIFTDAMSGKDQSHEHRNRSRYVKLDKAYKDDFLGKIAEYIALKELRENFGFPAVDIDLEVRQSGSKGWNADLSFNSHNKNFPNVHVKACRKKWGGDYSWVFQKRDEIWKNRDDDLVVFVFVEDEESVASGVIKAILPVKDIKKIRKEPVKPQYKKQKWCVYLEDMKNIVRIN